MILRAGERRADVKEDGRPTREAASGRGDGDETMGVSQSRDV